MYYEEYVYILFLNLVIGYIVNYIEPKKAFFKHVTYYNQNENKSETSNFIFLPERTQTHGMPPRSSPCPLGCRIRRCLGL